MRWQLQEAEREFSQLVQRALDEGPQVVTRRAGEAVVVLSVDEYRRLGGSEPGAQRPSRSGPNPSAVAQERAEVAAGAGASSPAADRLGLAQTFHGLAERWRAETEALSSVQQTVTHHAFQRIIGLGPGVVPLLLEELRREPDHWFWALSAITGENPVRPGSTFDEAVAAWLAWGRARELID
jgi:prevent-host-death family protein